VEPVGILARTLVEPESLLVQIPEKVVRLDADVGSLMPRFKRLQKPSMVLV
jgi:hypothetical protein